MRIALINGSPKTGESVSALLLNALEGFTGKEHTLTHYKIGLQRPSAGNVREMFSNDAVVLAFPLYSDGIPAHLFSILEGAAEGKFHPSDGPHVYALINNGFYEGRQTRIAFEILEHWCRHGGFRFGGGIGHGAGEMLPFLKSVPMGHGPVKNLGRALTKLSACIEAKKAAPVICISPNFPRFAWRFSAVNFFWKPLAKKNGMTLKDLRKQL
jgi:multimeric flavodoxin WrbA